MKLYELNQAGTLDSDYEVGEADPNSMTPNEQRAVKVKRAYDKIKHQYRNPTRAMRAAQGMVDRGEA